MEKPLFEPPGHPRECVTGLPCPNCGSELAFLSQYQRHYCYSCGRYAPDGFGDRGAKRCPTCTGILSYVAQYERYYCYRCNAYPAEGVFMVNPAGTEPVPANEPVAANPTAIVVVEPEKVEDPKPSPVEVSTEPKSEPEPLVEEEIPREESGQTPAKPPLVRQEILEGKKTALMDFCKAYNLDPSGTKEQLRQRLLSYLDELEAESEPAQPVETESPAVRGEVQEEPEAPWTVAPLISAYDVEIPHSSTEPNEPWVVEESPREEAVADVPTLTTTLAPVVARPTQTVLEPFTSAPVVVAPSPQTLIPETPAAPTPKTLHPCPRCSRGLTYIAQYDRWYCYSCRAYAPRAKARFACPTCGASLRWISQYERWWCDGCRRYASSDLPKPERALTTTAAIKQAAVRTAAPLAANIVHRHRSPGSAIGLLAFGMLLFVVYEILVDLPTALSIDPGVVITPDIAFGLRFFAFLLVVVGAMLGLSAVRDQR